MLRHADGRETFFAHTKGHIGVGFRWLAYLEHIGQLVARR